MQTVGENEKVLPKSEKQGSSQSEAERALFGSSQYFERLVARAWSKAAAVARTNPEPPVGEV